MEDIGIFYRHLVPFMVFCYILWTFGIVRGNLVYFSVLVFCTEKNLATLIGIVFQHCGVTAVVVTAAVLLLLLLCIQRSDNYWTRYS
jgi:uncharacterized membrane protein YciS (DUF1049 family)